jgi:hypothetical protein
MNHSILPADQARRRILAGGFMALGAAALARAQAAAPALSEVSRDAEAIHQEPSSRRRARVFTRPSPPPRNLTGLSSSPR